MNKYLNYDIAGLYAYAQKLERDTHFLGNSIDDLFGDGGVIKKRKHENEIDGEQLEYLLDILQTLQGAISVLTEDIDILRQKWGKYT